MSGGSLIELTGVRFAYGSEFALAVDRLAIEAGERVACIGPSGTGKTTLTRLMTGEMLPNAGTITFDGQCLSAMSDRDRRALRISRIGLVFQEFELLSHLTALENILLPYYVAERLRFSRAVQERAYELADACRIVHTLKRRPTRLSQGERQRVAICRAIITEPDAILCDEPTGSLDPRTADRVLDLLLEQVALHDATLFMVTHNHAVLPRFDRVIDITAMNLAPSDEDAERVA